MSPTTRKKKRTKVHSEWTDISEESDTSGSEFDTRFSDSTTSAVKASPTSDGEIVEAVKRAKAYRLCLRRIWAIAATLPDRENSLHSLIPAPGMFLVPSHDSRHHEHEQCTFDFCEHSRVDFTSVAQHHENCDKTCGHIEFPLQLLNERVAKGEPTAWKLEEPSLLNTSQTYMAVSHVWADGTGTGTWGPGKVNKCLYKFLCDIARYFQCDGCWWDTISIPRDDDARVQAINNMQNNYADARVTLVHDIYLRQWEWVDPETACFAIVMSPWYSRGWTSLELAKSHKVKILFKAKNDEYTLKDLDVDILDEIPSSSRYHDTAESIRKLRGASVQSFGDLLGVLGHRDTSKPRDMPIISGLLTGVNVSGGLSQQEIYQRILRKLGKVSQGHLFHNSATMSTPGFSWCPTNILDMPMAGTNSIPLALRESGELEGVWKVYSSGSVNLSDFIWNGTHPLTKAFLESALTGKNKEKHVLLVESGEQMARALLVRPARSKGLASSMLCCGFVGPVYLLSSLCDDRNKEFREISVRIGSTESMADLEQDAWEFVCSMADANNAAEKTSSLKQAATPVLQTSIYPFHNMADEAADMNMNSKDWKAVYYSQDLVPTSLFKTSCKLDNSGINQSGDMVLYFRNGENDLEPSTSQSFFYGNQDIIPFVKLWLKLNQKRQRNEIIMLVLDEDDEIYEDMDDTPTKNALASSALLSAVENGKKEGSEALIKLLLDNHVQHTPNTSGHTPLYLAVEGGDVHIVRRLLTNETNPANVDMTDMKDPAQMLLQMAVKRGRDDITELLLRHSKNLNVQEHKTRLTALHLAAKNGYGKIAKLLLKYGADPVVPDSQGHTPLHYAASNGHKPVVEALLEPVDGQKELARSHLVGFDEVGNTDGLTNEEIAENHDVELEENDMTESDKKIDEKSNEKVNSRLQKNKDGRTALHLAAQAGHDQIVAVLVNHGAKVCESDNNGDTALILAAETGHDNIVERLLEINPNGFEQVELGKALLLASRGGHREAISKLHRGGAKSGPQDSDGMTALHWTIEAGDLDNTRMLIENQDNLNIPNKVRKQSALILAADKGLRGIVALLLENRAIINLQDSDQRTALHWAAIRRNVDVVKELLSWESPGLINIPDSLGRTALHWAAHSGSSKATNLLLEAKAHHATDDKAGRSALILAAGNGHVSTVEALLDHGVNTKTYDKAGRSALDWAAINGFNKVIRKLLPKVREDDSKKRALQHAASHGHLSTALMLYESIKNVQMQAAESPTVLFLASSTPESSTDDWELAIDKLLEIVTNLDQKDDKGRTALMLAVGKSNRQLVEKLLDRDVDVNSQDLEGKTALIMATELDNEALVWKLLAKDADPNIQDNRGLTATCYSAMHDFQDNIYRLSAYGANFNLPDIYGRTALHISLEKSKHIPPEVYQGSGYFTIPWVLLQNGAKSNAQDNEGQTPLHLAVRKNQVPIATAMLKATTLSVKIRDNLKRTPLLIAAESEHTEMAKLLLEWGSDPNTEDATKRTPLLLAASKGNEKFVKVLLEKGADPNRADHQGRTALSQAAQNGHERVVRLLLCTRKTKPSLDIRDNMGRTALLLAAENGYLEIVKDLLSHKADSAIADFDGMKAWQKAMSEGYTSIVDTLLSDPDISFHDWEKVDEALLLASRRGWDAMVEVLLEKNANVNFQSKEGWTALHVAVMKGHRKVVKTLLKKGISVNIKDCKGRTALMQSVEHGFESIVNLLLARQKTQAGIDDWMGREALSLAAEKGYVGIVKLLLEKNVDCNNPVDSMGRTAMSLAAMSGNKDIVEQLLKKNANNGIKDSYDRTSLHHAAWGGHEDVVEILLKHGADFRALDSNGRSALHLAAERASERVVERLLENRDNANLKSKDGQTALHRAAWGGSTKVVSLLRKNGADPFIRDNLGNKPWHVAATKGHESIAAALLEDESNVDEERISKKHPLIFAAQMGYTIMARSLLKKGADPAVKDVLGLTMLHWAAARGNKEMVDLIIERREELINILDNQKQTALCHSVLKGWTAVVEILLRAKADTGISDETGRTVLHHAAREGNWEIVRLLVSNKADPHARDGQKKKAWQLAAEGGFHRIVGLLLEKEVYHNLQSQQMEDLLFRMISGGPLPMVRLLLDKGVNKNAKNRYGDTLIIHAAIHHREDIFRLLLSRGADTNISGVWGNTPLLQAAKGGNANMIRLLLDNIPKELSDDRAETSSILKDEMAEKSSHVSDEEDAIRNNHNMSETFSDESDEGNEGGSMRKDITLDSTHNTSHKANIINHSDIAGQTALLIATESLFDAAVEALLDKGLPELNINAQDKRGRTALYVAVEQRNLKLFRTLLRKSPNLALQDNLGFTVLHLAVEQHNLQLVKALLEHSTDYLNITDHHGRTAMHIATERGHEDLVNKLLRKGADLNLADNLGRTALLLAAENGNKNVVDLLLRNGADQSQADLAKRTPLLLAVANGDKTVVELLLNHPGSDVDFEDSQGRTLQTLAVQSGNKDVLWMLMTKQRDSLSK
ncbi:ankyrin repeat protein [Paramyrothecium foliicola]|nr:ankyrin repeat protein [Paramyrothecium foliicola]